MPRARTSKQEIWQTADSPNGSGCLSFYSLTVLAVIFISCLLTIFAFNTPNAFYTTPNSDTLHISPIFTTEVQYWEQNILRWANASSLDPNLVATIMQIESCGDPFATSSAGAMGLFQVMPFHFQRGEDPYSPNTNALRGLGYLAQSVETSRGNVRLALAGYNGGIGVITRNEWAWPAETLRYVYYGAPIYADAQSGAASSYMLDEWYRKYGASLCRRASQKLGIEK